MFYCDHYNTNLTRMARLWRRNMALVGNTKRKWKPTSEMDGRTSPEPERQNNCYISIKKDTSYSCMGKDPTTPQSPGSTSPSYNASTPYGGSSHVASDGPSSFLDDASGTCSGMSLPTGSYMPALPGSPMMRSLAHPMWQVHPMYPCGK